jgi:hypothetical protein
VTALSGTAPSALGLADLRRAAGLTRVQAAARLVEVLPDGIPASKWMLEQAETGRLPVAWRFTARRAALVAAMAQAYGHPAPVVAATWHRAFPPLAAGGNPSNGLP